MMDRLKPNLLRFGDCLIDLATREISVSGASRPVQPKVFSFIVCLIERRHRTVPKDEVVREIWSNEHVSEASIARLVLQARRALHIEGSSQSWIRTVHSVGYRFVGDVAEFVRPALDATAAFPGTNGVLLPGSPPQLPVVPEAVDGLSQKRIRLGLVPCRVDAAIPGHQWLGSGLVALIAHGLARDKSIELISLEPLISRSSSGAAPEFGPDEIRLSFALLGLDYLVTSKLRGQKATLWLDHELWVEDRIERSESFKGLEPLALADRMTKSIIDHFTPDNRHTIQRVSDDPLVSMAFARAAELYAREDFAKCLKVLDAACALEPDSVELQFQRVRALTWLRDPSAPDEAQSIVARFPEGTDAASLALRLEVAAMALFMHPEHPDAALSEVFRQRALAIASEAGNAHWASRIRFNAAIFYLEKGRHDMAREIFESLEHDARRTGDKLSLAYVQQNSVLLDIARADYIGARQRIEESVAIWRHLPQRQAAHHATMTHAICSAFLGLFREAKRLADATLPSVEASYTSSFGGVVLSGLSYTYFLIGDAEKARLIDKVFTASGSAANESSPMQLAAQAVVSLFDGRSHDALNQLALAFTRGRLWPGDTFARRWGIVWAFVEASVVPLGQELRASHCLVELNELVPTAEARGALVYVEAIRCYRAGRSQQATSLLKQLVNELPFCLVSMMARLDLAWLACDDGDTEAASICLQIGQTWSSESPLALFAHARLCFERGEMHHAQELLSRSKSARHTELPTSLRAFADVLHGEAKAPSNRSKRLHLPNLLCMTWWQL